MKLLVFSDAHGSEMAAKRLKKVITSLQPDRIVCLGDILHGGYDEGGTELLTLLRKHSNIITAVQGNCDFPSDADDLLFSLPEYAAIVFDGHACHLSHHQPYVTNFPPGDIVMYGHTHMKKLERVAGVTWLNPGSCCNPRDEGTSYALIENGEAGLYNLDDMSLIKKVEL
jgi:phosphoesterase, MJ0936 family